MEQIAIDGPASSGKSSVAKLLAQKLGYIYVDTGAMYRALTLYLLEQEVDYQQAEALAEAIEKCQIEFILAEDQQLVLLNGRDVTKAIRSQAVNDLVSEVSAIAQVRTALVKQQQQLAACQNLVMDGRDIGTVVLPQATHKFFFTASPQVRAQRRFKENQAKGLSTESLAEIEASIIARDTYDANREHSPLRQAEDAVLIDTGQYQLMELVDVLMARIVEGHSH